MAPSGPIALPSCTPVELVTFILTLAADEHRPPTTIVVCQPRDVFLDSLTKSIRSESTIEYERDYDGDGEPSEIPDLSASEHVTSHALSVPTLRQLLASRRTTMVFVPMVVHFRAWTAAYATMSTIATPKLQKHPAARDLLIVYGLVDMHRDGSEWSVQGLSSSLAGLVEAGHASGKRVVVVESRHEEQRETWAKRGIHQTDPELIEAQKNRQVGVWDEHVPMLNGSARRAGFSGHDTAWSGRVVEIGSVLSRWFTFSDMNWERVTS